MSDERLCPKVDDLLNQSISCGAAARVKPRATLWEPWEATTKIRSRGAATERPNQRSALSVISIAAPRLPNLLCP